MRSVFTVLTLLACLFPLHAQQTGTLSGTIVDQSGKPIPNAAVEVRNEVNGDSYQATAGDVGRFAATGLAAGTYSVRVTTPGFALATRSHGQVSAGATLDVPITLSVESLATVVTVNETISLAATNGGTSKKSLASFR